MRISDWSSDVCSSDLAAIVSKRVMTNIENARRDLRGIFASETSEGVKNTAYGLVQGAVEYSQWFRSTRGQNDQDPAENLFRRSFLDRDRPVQSAARLAQARSLTVCPPPSGPGHPARPRPDERRVGKECARTCRFRGSP